MDLWEGVVCRFQLITYSFILQAWINLYSARRYGQSVPSVQDAWNILYHTIYNCTDGAYVSSFQFLILIPDLDMFLISSTFASLTWLDLFLVQLSVAAVLH